MIFLKTIPFRPWTVCFLQPWTHPSLIRFSHLSLESILKSETKSLASVQKAMLNITGTLCCLHDALTSNKDVSKEDIKSVVEQSLYLLGSANCQFSSLRKKILVTINKDKIGLADQSLPNVKCMLFGDNFSSIASKHADLSRGLAKNLGTRPAKQARPTPMHPPNRSKPYTGNYNKYQSN